MYDNNCPNEARVMRLDTANVKWSHNTAVNPTQLISTGTPFKVKLDGTKLTAPISTDLTLIGPNTDQYVDGMNLDPNQVGTIAFRPKHALDLDARSTLHDRWRPPASHWEASLRAGRWFMGIEWVVANERTAGRASRLSNPRSTR